VIGLQTLGALAATAALAAGIAELGRALRGSGPVGRWVRGWTLLWWIMALSAQILGPAIAAIIGSLIVLGAFAAWGYRERKRAQPWLVGGAAIAVGAPLILCPPHFYDALVYHIGMPWTWLINHDFSPLAHHMFSHFPIAAQVIYLIPVSWGIPEAAAGLHWMTLMVAMVASYELAGRLGAARWAAAGPVLLVGCWHLLWIGGQAAADMLVLVGVLAAVNALLDESGPRWIDIGLGCGLAIASKYTAVLPVAAVLIVALVFAWRQWRGALLAGAVAAGTASFVLIRNLILTGNPVYPLLWKLLGGAGWSARDNDRWAALVRTGIDELSSVPSAMMDRILPPGGLGWWFALALPLATIALARRSENASARHAVAAIAMINLLGWLFVSHTVRFAFPLAALVAVIAAAGMAKLPKRLTMVAAAMIAATVLNGVLMLGDFAFSKLQIQRMWTGEATPEEWRHRVTVNDPLPAYRAAAASLEASSRILVVGEGRSWGCTVPHHVSSSYDLQLVQEWNEASTSAEDLARKIAAAGYSHLLINWGELQRLGGAGFQVLRWREQADAQRWSSFLEEWTIPQIAQRPCEIRALRPPYMGPNSHGE
jgi:hypothetical protein